MGSRVDGQLAGMNYELINVETAKPLLHDSYGPKFDADFEKMTRNMHDALRSVHEDIGYDRASSIGVQSIGILEQGLQWSVYSLRHEGYTSYLQMRTQRQIPTAREDIADFLDIMREVLRIQLFVKSLRNQLKPRADDNDLIPEVTIFDLVPTPSKQLKSKEL